MASRLGPKAARGQSLLRNHRGSHHHRNLNWFLAARSNQGLILECCLQRRRSGPSHGDHDVDDPQQKNHGKVSDQRLSPICGLGRHRSHGGGGYYHVH